MNKKKRQAISLVSVLTMLVAFFVSPIISLAATVDYKKVADYTSTWCVAGLGGTHWTDEGIFMIQADNQPAFCIEHSILLNGGSGFEPSELNSAEKERLSLISYYVYQVNPTIENYGITQNIIWEELGDTLLTTQLPNYANRKNDILTKVANHQVKPSFTNQTIELNVGDSITLTDTNDVLEKYSNLLENSANLKIEKNGNTLKLTATADSKESGKLQYSMVSKDQVGQSFVYKKPGEQTVATFKLSNAGEMNLNIKVNLDGNVKLKKIDEDTGQPVPNTKMKFEYNGQTKEIVTDADGFAQINDLKAGTKVKIPKSLPTMVL